MPYLITLSMTEGGFKVITLDTVHGNSLLEVLSKFQPIILRKLVDEYEEKIKFLEDEVRKINTVENDIPF
jgi:hypothetical protein